MSTREDRFAKHIALQREAEAEELSKHKSAIDSFRAFAEASGLLLKDEHFSYSPPTGVTANYPNIVKMLNLGVNRDKEGLVNFREAGTKHQTHPFAHGLLFGKNYVLLAHPYFRRSFHRLNNFAPRFIEFFWSLNDPQIDSFIAIDFDRVRINMDQSSYMELDTWYGSKFNHDIGQIKNEVVKLRPPLDIDSFDNDFLFAGGYCLDIVWETDKNIKTYKSEEFKAENVTVTKDGRTYHPVRYIHAEYDLAKEHFRHFDGAIHFYSPEEYYTRRDSDMNYNSKNLQHIKTPSEKLFKLNGVVSVDTWINFVSHFMTGNPLVIEYFEGKYPARVEEILNAIRKQGGA
jgi:hypothetical protein